MAETSGIFGIEVDRVQIIDRNSITLCPQGIDCAKVERLRLADDLFGPALQLGDQELNPLLEVSPLAASSCRFITLPLALRGNSGRKSKNSGTLK